MLLVKFGRDKEPELFQSGLFFFLQLFLNLISKLGDFKQADFWGGLKLFLYHLSYQYK